MKNHLTVRVSGALLIASLLIPALALAADVRAGHEMSIGASEFIPGNAYIAGGSVTSAATIRGDLVAAGGTIIVNGAVSSDVLAAGGTVTVLGPVGGDVRVGGGTVIINSSVRNDVVVGGGETNISGAGVGGDVVWGGGTLVVTAPVAGNLTLRGGNVTINSTVRGNVEFKGGSLTLGKGALLMGNLSYQSPKEATMETGAVVKGKTTYVPRKDARDFSKAGLAALISLALLLKFLSIFACALILGLFLQRFALETVRLATAQPLLEMGRGLVVLIVLPIVSVLLLITLIGLPLGFLGLLSFAAITIAAAILAPIILGSIAHKSLFKTATYQVNWKTILLGSFLYLLLRLIPVVGWLAACLFFLLAVGSMLKIKWETIKEWK